MVVQRSKRDARRSIPKDSGFTFIELVVVIVILGVFVTVATRTMDTSIEASRQAQVEDELNRLAIATTGNDQLFSGGLRTDFGYVGDIGALPISLDYLISNPGGFATWNGPYLRDNFVENSNDFKTDPWGVIYAYSAGVTFQSTGSGSAITKQFANSTADILSTPLRGTVLDRNGAPPGTDALNVSVTISYPNGAGGLTSSTVNPNSSGSFAFTGIPIGNHSVTAIYNTANDTAISYSSSLPRVGAFAGELRLGSAYWTDTTGGGGAGGPSSEILRPIGVGSKTQLVSQNCATNWTCVSESTPDNGGTYLENTLVSLREDTYDTQNSSIGVGVIDSVVFYIHCSGSGASNKAKTYIRVSGSNYQGPLINLSTTWTTYSTVYASSPATGIAWSWNEINALEVGGALNKSGKCTQVWAEVFYQ